MAARIITPESVENPSISTKRAFNVFEVEETGEHFIVTANWRNPEKDSSHYAIWLGMNSALGETANARYYPSVDGLKWLTKGYLRPGPQKGAIEIYDLAGASIWSSPNKLSASGLEAKQLFKNILGLKVTFAPNQVVPPIIYGRR